MPHADQIAGPEQFEAMVRPLKVLFDRGLMDEGTIDTRTAKGIAERIEEAEAERGE